MQRTNIKNYLLISGIACVVLGIAILSLLSSPEMYLGIIFLIFAIVLIASYNFLSFQSSEEGKLRSRTRERLLKHQLKK